MTESLRSCVIYNPMAGRGRARKQIEVTRAKLDPQITLFASARPSHAIELTQQAIADGFDHIIAAGGDGTVHEVAAGILNSGRPEVRLGIWPLGSMNDLAFALGLLNWWKEPTRPLQSKLIDVGEATTAAKRMWFVNAAGVGFNGMVTIESRKTRWLKGLPLYAWGLIKAMVKHYHKPIMTIECDSKSYEEPTVAFSLCLGQREGGFPLGKHAILDDGLFDVVHVGAVKRWELIRYLPNLITGNLPKNHPYLHEHRSSWSKVKCDTPLCCHLDGEFLCTPDDGITAIDFQIHKQRLLVDCFE